MLRSMRSALIRAQGMDKKVAGIRRNIIILVSLVPRPISSATPIGNLGCKIDD